MSREEAGLTCIGAGGKIVSRLSVQVFHASAEQPGTLQFTGESAAWIARLNEKRLADYRRVIDTLSGNGIAGNVLLSTGESFDVVRFGRLSAPDFYALRTPEHGLTFLSDLVSVKWTADGISVTERDGEQYMEAGKGLTPGNTLVRLLPTDDNQLQAVALSLDEPFRFVYLDSKSKQPRQALVRADDRILQINVAAKPSVTGGSIETHFDKKERDAFRKALVADAQGRDNHRQEVRHRRSRRLQNSRRELSGSDQAHRRVPGLNPRTEPPATSPTRSTWCARNTGRKPKPSSRTAAS
jgi:hypothetical protein